MKKSQEQAELRILTGPDTRGKRWLRWFRSRSKEPPETENLRPPRALTDAPLFTGQGRPTRFDPDHNPELQGDLPPVQREPGAEG